MTAEEVVSGTFRNVSGLIVSIDIAGSTLVVKDLTTKKQVTIKVAADTQMRQLPDRMATMLAAVLNGNAGGFGGRSGAAGGQGQPAAARRAAVAAKPADNAPAMAAVGAGSTPNRCSAARPRFSSPSCRRAKR